MLNIGDSSIRCLEKNTHVHQQIQTLIVFNSENRSSGLETGQQKILHQSIPPAPRAPPGVPRGIRSSFQLWGWGICKFCTAPGPGVCQPRGHSQAFDTHAPPGYRGAIARLFSCGGGAFVNFALPGGRAFANRGAIPKLLTRMRFPIRI